MIIYVCVHEYCKMKGKKTFIQVKNPRKYRILKAIGSLRLNYKEV